MNLLSKLHQWSLGIMVTFLGISCSKNNVPIKEEDKIIAQPAHLPKQFTRPVAVLYITDEQAKTNREGEMYYDDANGYRYWKFCDGTYYLDVKYDQLIKEKSQAGTTTIKPGY